MHAAMPPLASYELLVPPRIVFGAGRVAEVGGIVGELGGAAWIVAGERSGAASGGLDAVEAACRAAGVPSRRVASSRGEPTVDQVAAAVARLPRAGREEAVIVAVGGGATIDLAKAVAALATNAPADATDLDAVVVDHLEGSAATIQEEHAEPADGATSCGHRPVAHAVVLSRHDGRIRARLHHAVD